MNKKFEFTYFAIFAVLWTFIEPVVSILKLEDINPLIPKFTLVILFLVPLIIYIKNKYFDENCKYTNLQKNVKKAIHKGLLHLENNNLNENGQRFRHTPSLMESSTVIGSIYLARDTLNLKEKEDIQTIMWLINSLKQQFSGKCPVKYFDCYKCQNKQICNVGYFDYLSHLYYAKNTTLFIKLQEEFTFLIDIFEKRLKEYDSFTGWTLYENETETIDPLSTSTILILLHTFNYQKKNIIKKILLSLIKQQSKNGAWLRNYNEDEYCAGELEIITTHRVIEAMMLYKNSFKIKNIDNSIDKGIEFLKSSSGYEVPVNYEIRSGMIEKELLRGIGHIIQACIKAKEFSFMLDDYVKFILCKQEKDGSFIGTTNTFESNKQLVFHTDLTAFLTRTLCLYYNAKYKSS
jgi:hypothetical protein